MKNPPVIYPFLFAIFPILALYSFNRGQTPTKCLVMPLVATFSLTLLLWAALSLIFKDKKRRGLFVFLFMFLFFSYGHFHLALVSEGLEVGQHKYLFPIWGILFIAGTYLITKIRSNLHNHTLVLNLVTALLLISSLMKIIPYELERSSAGKTISQARNAVDMNVEAQGIRSDKDVTTPDIYYIIFDRYANPNTLEEFFDYDNKNFTDYLLEQGFYVAFESRANYPRTLLSLTSSLNMEHLDYLKAVKESDDYTVIYAMLHDYRVWRFLKARGYEFIHFGDWWDPTRANPFADMSFNYHYPLKLNGFSLTLLKTTALNPVIETFPGDSNSRNREALLRKFEILAHIPETEGPKFVFAHMLMPHDPYVFGPNGEPLTKAETETRSEVENYLNQLDFTNEQIKRLVDEILSKSDVPPIIIIQSDEGPLIAPEFLSEEFMATKDWSRISEEALKTHMAILNAYYLPDFDYDLLYASLSPVNSFRVIFNYYFGTDFELLEDRSYISQGSNLPYNLIDATDILSN